MASPTSPSEYNTSSTTLLVIRNGNHHKCATIANNFKITTLAFTGFWESQSSDHVAISVIYWLCLPSQFLTVSTYTQPDHFRSSLSVRQITITSSLTDVGSIMSDLDPLSLPIVSHAFQLPLRGPLIFEVRESTAATNHSWDH
ncbi:hypothetical protein AFLA_011932 [Aspergillus flavus NRRL3357]|nr:hypothetical protein AFLA_011932 [Aspergillus flavus NRRL3357]